MKVNLFSAVKGVVTLNGKPVVGALIKRTAIPNSDKEYFNSIKTDSEGRFSFPVMETHLWLKLLPGQSTVFQKMLIEYNGEQYLGWEGTTDDTNKGELN